MTGRALISKPHNDLVIAALSVIGIAGFLWPLWSNTATSESLAHATDAPWLMVLMMPLLLAATASALSERLLDAKAVAVLGVLAACGSALRLPTGGVAGTELVFFLLLPAGRVFGRGFGFLLGTLTLFVSAAISGGIGPWLPFQMLGAAWVGYGAGLLPPLKGRAEIAAMALYGTVASFVYGALLNLWFWPFGTNYGSGLSYVPSASLTSNLRAFWAFHLATSLGWDLMRAVTLVTMCWVLGRPVLAALERAQRRGGFAAVARFEPSEHEPPLSTNPR